MPGRNRSGTLRMERRVKTESPAGSDAPRHQRAASACNALGGTLHQHTFHLFLCRSFPVIHAHFPAASRREPAVNHPFGNQATFGEPKAHGFASRPCDRFALSRMGGCRPMCGQRARVRTRTNEIRRNQETRAAHRRRQTRPATTVAEGDGSTSAQLKPMSGSFAVKRYA